MEDIKLIVGLGNPEPEYSKTRHNLGFDVINKIQENSNIKVKTKQFDGLFGIGKLNNKDIMLLKPQTYMNNSGKSIIQVVKKYDLKPEQILVIYDDMDLAIGQIKIRKLGSAGSHNGVKSVTYYLGSEKFNRIRLGIGKPLLPELTIPYVIGKLSDEDNDCLEELRNNAYDCTIEILNNGLDSAMNKYNRKV